VWGVGAAQGDPNICFERGGVGMLLAINRCTLDGRGRGLIVDIPGFCLNFSSVDLPLYNTTIHYQCQHLIALSLLAFLGRIVGCVLKATGIA